MAQDPKDSNKQRDYYAAGGTFDDQQPWQTQPRPTKRPTKNLVEPESVRRRRVRRRKGYDSFREILLFAVFVIVFIVAREFWFS